MLEFWGALVVENQLSRDACKCLNYCVYRKKCYRKNCRTRSPKTFLRKNARCTRHAQDFIQVKCVVRGLVRDRPAQDPSTRAHKTARANYPNPQSPPNTTHKTRTTSAQHRAQDVLGSQTFWNPHKTYAQDVRTRPSAQNFAQDRAHKTIKGVKGFFPVTHSTSK